MTIIAHRFDDGVRKQQNVHETMGTAQPPGQIRRCWCQVDARICVGVEGSQGGVLGGRNGGIKMSRLIVQLGSWGFFYSAMHNSWHVISPSKCMVHPSCKYLCRLIWGRGTRRWCQNWPVWLMGGIISIFGVLQIGTLCQPWPTRR